MTKLKKGFTLIEMIVVVFIIALLASIVIVEVNNSRMNARDAKRIQDIDTINTAIQLYADANSGQYPAPIAASAPVCGCGCWVISAPTGDSNYDRWLASATMLQPYISTLPADPINNYSRGYEYIYSCVNTGAGPYDYKIEARNMESVTGLAKAKNTNDGGNNDNAFEIFSSGAQGAL